MAKYAFLTTYKQEPTIVEYMIIHDFFKSYGFLPLADGNVWIAIEEGLNPIIKIGGRIPISITRHLIKLNVLRIDEFSDDLLPKIGAK